jgi:hypothetical protein
MNALLLIVTILALCRWALVRKILQTVEMCVYVSVCVHHSQEHMWAQDHQHAICQRGYQIRFSVNFWNGSFGAISVG